MNTPHHPSELEGRFDWASVATWGRLAAAFSGASVILHFWLAPVQLPGRTMFAGLTLLACGAGLLQLIVGLTDAVTRFQLANGQLTVWRPGRRRLTVTMADIVDVDGTDESAAETIVGLQCGQNLHILHDHLSHSRELVRRLLEARPQTDCIVGQVSRGALAGWLIRQTLVAGLLCTIAAVALLCLTLGLNPKNLLPNPEVFQYLGLVVLLLCGVGFWRAVIRAWIGLVHSFRWDGSSLQYRTFLSGTQYQRCVNDVESLSTHRTRSADGEAGTWCEVRFRKGERIRLHSGILRNAHGLFLALKSEFEKRCSRDSAGPLQPIDAQHPLRAAIQGTLTPSERVLWLGRPVCRKLSSEIAAEVLFGLIPGTFGAGLLVMGFHLVVNQGDTAAWAAVAFGSLLCSIAAYMVTAPWRYGRLLRHTVYAVTTQRIFILHGVLWGSRSAVQPSGLTLESFDRKQALQFETVNHGRDIVLGGHWRHGRRGQPYRVHSGFLAPQDPGSAVNAIRHLLNIPEAQAAARTHSAGSSD